MINPLEVTGLVLQTVAGLMFIGEQSKKLDTTKIVTKISNVLVKFRDALNNTSKKPHRFSLISTFLTFLVIIATIFWFGSTPHDAGEMFVWFMIILFICAFSIVTYIETLSLIFGLFVKGHRKLIYKLPPPSVSKERLKFVLETKYFSDINIGSSQYTFRYNISNVIICLVSLAIIILSIFCLNSSINNHYAFSGFFIVFSAICYLIFLPMFLLSLLYLMVLGMLWVIKCIIPRMWIFLLFLWLSGGVLLIVNAIIT
jgi:hypothetical protein